MTVIEFVKAVAAEFGLSIDDDDADYVLWEHTGWPCFFREEGTYAQVLRPLFPETRPRRHQDGLARPRILALALALAVATGDEELARLRLALRDPVFFESGEGAPEAVRFAAEAFGNLDEWLMREGRLPAAWGASKE